MKERERLVSVQPARISKKNKLEEQIWQKKEKRIKSKSINLRLFDEPRFGSRVNGGVGVVVNEQLTPLPPPYLHLLQDSRSLVLRGETENPQKCK